MPKLKVDGIEVEVPAVATLKSAPIVCRGARIATGVAVLLGLTVLAPDATAQSSRRQMLDDWSECMWTKYPDMARSFVAPNFSGTVRTGPACSGLLRERLADIALASLRKVRMNRLDACILRNPKALSAINAPLKPLNAGQRKQLVAIELEARRAEARAQGSDPAAVATDLSDNDIAVVRVLRMPMLREVAAAGKKCDSEGWKIVAEKNRSSPGIYLMSLSRKAK